MAARAWPPERWAAALLALHLLLLLWVGANNSVTFDESFHLPAGVRILTRADFLTSFAQPPLVKTVCAVPALLAGARPPDDRSAGPGAERFVGESFMRANVDRFERVYAAARLPVMLMSLALGWLVFRAARAWYGPAGGLLALAFYVASPEPLAHGSLVGVDLPTGLTFLGATLAFAAFARGGGWRRWLVAAAWVAAAFLTRFSAVQLVAIFALLLAGFAAAGRLRRPLRAWLGLAALAPVALLAVNAGYLFQGTFEPLAPVAFLSDAFHRLQHAAPGLRLPLPDAYVRGLDYLAYLAQPGLKASYALGRVRWTGVWWYFPLAIAVKWPLGLLAALAARAFVRERRGGGRARARALTLLVPAAVVVGAAMSANLDYGVRYVFPALPFLCVWLGGLAALGAAAPARPRRPARWPALAAALVAATALEGARALPYPLSFFNLFAGGHGDRIVNDSNVDWGQGLVALRATLRRLGIQRVHLAYHGTVDPRVYGIDYVPYTGGAPGPESDYFAVSSYFFVGLPARMTTYLGQSGRPVSFDLEPLWRQPAIARPAGCMYLFRVR